ncbi:VanZ family protein [Spirosoma koreense]
MRILYFIIVLGVALVFYLSWIPDPNLKDVWFIPNWLGRWTDTKANEDIRTGVPFVILGLCAGFIPLFKFRRGPARWLSLWLLLVGVVTLAEIGQLFLPHRGFSWTDIGWGALGASVGLAMAGLVSLKRS